MAKYSAEQIDVVLYIFSSLNFPESGLQALCARALAVARVGADVLADDGLAVGAAVREHLEALDAERRAAAPAPQAGRGVEEEDI